MKVFICVVLLATIATAIPVENAQEDLHERSASSSSEKALPEEPIAQDPTHVVEDAKTQTEDASRDKRHIFFHSLPVVYAAAPVVYAAPVVKTVVCFEHINFVNSPKI